MLSVRVWPALLFLSQGDVMVAYWVHIPEILVQVGASAIILPRTNKQSRHPVTVEIAGAAPVGSVWCYFSPIAKEAFLWSGLEFSRKSSTG